MRPLAERADHTLGPQSAKLALGQAYWACGNTKEALELYDSLLADLKARQLPPSAALLAATARLAAVAGDQARAIELEEAALAIEHERLPEMINVAAYRQRYQWLWEQLSAKAREAVGKDAKATDAWLVRAERAWRQWYEVDHDNASMMHQMATLQRAAGREDRAWLYLSTLIDQRPKDAGSYASVAQWYAGRNELTQAEQFYARAHPWDLANPQWLVQRAELLDRLDRKAEARQLYQQVVDGKWPPGRQGYVEQAKKALK
jgi:tetratricopeptide (TPR) repeat protein